MSQATPTETAGDSLLRFARERRFGAILADPPWQFANKTGKVAPEHRRLARYGTMTLDELYRDQKLNERPGRRR